MHKTFSHNGVTLAIVTDSVLYKALSNKNSVILLASTEDLYTPVFYQRYCDYIDKASLDKLQLTEALRPYVLDPFKYPEANKKQQQKIIIGELE